MTEKLTCHRCDREFDNQKEIVIDRPLYPFGKFTRYYHAECYNYNRYKVLPKDIQTLRGTGNQT